jgi:hypothetical protein
MFVSVDAYSIFRPSTIEKFRVHPTLNPNVGLLRLFPNITIQAVSFFLFSTLLRCNQNTLCSQSDRMNLPVSETPLNLFVGLTEIFYFILIMQICRSGATVHFDCKQSNEGHSS